MAEQRGGEPFVVLRDGDRVVISMTSEAAMVFSGILKRMARIYSKRRRRVTDLRESKKLGLRAHLLSSLSAALRIKARAIEGDGPKDVFIQPEEE